MTPLKLVMTTAGQNRFTVAQSAGEGSLAVHHVGFTDQAFVAAPSLTALPGQFAAIDTVASAPVGDNIVHLTVRDESQATYEVRGFGLFLADGTLFAVYAQADPLVEKSARATLLIAVDIAFPGDDVTQLVFGATDFIYPPATTETLGVVKIATPADADAGTDTQKAMTPALVARVLGGVGQALAAIAGRRITGGGLVTGGGDLSADRTLTVTAATPDDADAGTDATKVITPPLLKRATDALAASVGQALAGLTGRTIGGGGLVTGGGDLSANRTLTVDAASAAEVAAGVALNKAVTPGALAGALAPIAADRTVTLPGGRIQKIGALVQNMTPGDYSVVFATPFPNACLNVSPTAVNTTGSGLRDNWFQIRARSAAGFTVTVQSSATASDSSLDGLDWVAWGE